MEFESMYKQNTLNISSYLEFCYWDENIKPVEMFGHFGSNVNTRSISSIAPLIFKH